MSRPPLRFRQIHLDFHTSPEIPAIGASFDKKHWQETLQSAAVDSITCFAKCHHGWSYHPTTVGKQHPGLGFDLLRAQFDACKEIGVNVPIYLSAGVDDLVAYEHPEWREITPEGGYGGWQVSPLQPGFRTVDFHSPYLDYLCAQIEEVVRLFPDCDGIFLDIISQCNGVSRWSMDYMLANGLDPRDAGDRWRSGQAALQKYYERTTAAARILRKDMPVFHNSGHITRGDRNVIGFQSHLELESLPTGGWGYDHFPESARYTTNFDKEYLGMTGKFHTTWSEFGGYKHPNALRYECAAMIALGARCSVGDQLHPDGRLDESTYKLIGEAYREVAQKEPWCIGTKQVADIGVLSNEAEKGASARNNPGETGAARILLEGHHLFLILDREMDFSSVRLLILADDIRIDEALHAKLTDFLARGGRLLLTGESGMWKDKDGFAFDIGADWSGPSPFKPDYLRPSLEVQPSFVGNPMVMYLRSQRIKATKGKSLGTIFDPYFNREGWHYCGHQHTPARPEPSGFDGGVTHGQITYLAHPVFSIYRAYGAVAVKEYLHAVLEQILPERVLKVSLPSTARVALTRQEAQGRHVLHLLYANTISRGGPVRLEGGNVSTGGTIEVIDELLPLHDTKVSVRLPKAPAAVRLAPEGTPVPFCAKEDGTVEFTIERFACHQMIELADEA